MAVTVLGTVVMLPHPRPTMHPHTATEPGGNDRAVAARHEGWPE